MRSKIKTISSEKSHLDKVKEFTYKKKQHKKQCIKKFDRKSGAKLPYIKVNSLSPKINKIEELSGAKRRKRTEQKPSPIKH